MTHIVDYNPEFGIIETMVQGQLTMLEAKEFISEIAQMAVEQNCFLCLSDYRQATMEMSTLQIHDLPKVIAHIVTALGVHPSHFKRAIVVEKDFNDYHFFETVTLNAGQSIKLFHESDHAKKWLLQE